MSNPPQYATRKNPTTGKLETYEVNKQAIDLEKSRKEFRDFIHGNTQWYDDPNTTVVEKKPVDVDFEDDQYADFYNNYSKDIS
jgi:diacylglycerol kinase family enzyme